MAAIHPLGPEELQIAALAQLVGSYRFDLSDEKRLQYELEQAFSDAGLNFERECPLDEQDIPDFILNDTIAIEVKLKGHQKRAIFRQLSRYARHQHIQAVVLLTNVSMGLPESVDGTPLFYISLSEGWM